MKTLYGLCASSGAAIGHVYSLYDNLDVSAIKKTVSQPAAEIEKLRAARISSSAQIETLIARAKKLFGEKEVEVFDSHKTFIEDDIFFDEIEAYIKTENTTAAWAVQYMGQLFIDMLSTADDAYIAQRVADIRDIIDRVTKNVLGIAADTVQIIETGAIIVAHELTPSASIQLDISKVAAFVTETGGINSHVAILARSAGIPAAVGVEHICEAVQNGNAIAVDASAETAAVFLNPDNTVIQRCTKKMEQQKQRAKYLKKYIDKPTCTADGAQKVIFANIGTPQDLEQIKQCGAEGIGLFRTEFLYMSRDTLPSEQEQFEVYKYVVENMGSKPVIIRTIDIGGDKDVDSLNLKKEENPFLGYRAIRLCLDQPELFKEQLRAMLRAGVYGNLKIMFPMISSLEELRAAKDIVAEACKELDARNEAYNNEIEIGMMIEIPATAILAKDFAKEVDFFSIGTNDLTQYTVAADRGNSKVAHLNTTYNPAVLRLVKMAIDGAHEAGIACGMCGEAASDTMLAPLLIGLGLDEFSMSATSILNQRECISFIDSTAAERLAQNVLCAPDATVVHTILMGYKETLA
jgi:phosphoenolpyruvate-protein phosphotransferase